MCLDVGSGKVGRRSSHSNRKGKERENLERRKDREELTMLVEREWTGSGGQLCVCVW